ncbi:pyridoxamine 5'-phosphate oxidase family protein [bacterium SCSIO 12696]|nr:pyridoxamine 5'-phosphate oxidase family protein [bacterium SCSIO 12696]
MPKTQTSKFHAAEIAVQKRRGVAEVVAEYGEDFIREAMPQQHRDFFSELPFVLLGLVDQRGYPWAVPLFGPRGFISSPSNTRLVLNALPTLTGLLDLDFKHGQKIGLLGIQLETRRRNRMNGVIDSIGENSFSIEVEQSFGNCPKYIQKRELVWMESNAFEDVSRAKIHSCINKSVKALIEGADTFFITSRTKAFNQNASSGIDASHRGGKPGFVRVDGSKLYFPDFSGNNFFNTLGNIQSDGRVGLFFPDFVSGDSVFVSGVAQILWDDSLKNRFEGSQCVIQVDVESVVHIPGFMPMRGELVERSPAIEQTGEWRSVDDIESDPYRQFQVVEIKKESDAITSFFLEPLEGASIEKYTPGQFLPIRLYIPGSKQPVQRTYTLSRAPVEDGYRISVKREEQGLVSKYLHDQVGIGTVIQAGVPSGQFTLQANNCPVVLISGGVGITPMIAMLEGVVNDIEQGAEPRPVWFIHATQNSKTQAFAKALTLFSGYEWLTIHTVFSQPLPTDRLGRTHQSEGRISAELLKQIPQLDKCDVYLCGSEGFMRAIYADLLDIGISQKHIRYEFFGEGSISAKETTEEVADKAVVTFSESKVIHQWKPSDGTLLEFAEKQGLAPLYSCRSGNCGACISKLKSGEVSYGRQLGFALQEGEVLICCAKPAKDCSELTIEV